jgi:glycosyltransferase involved in cell wall biosynthesis
MLSHSYYEEDPRVRREAESLVAAGRPVDVYALRRRGDGEMDVVDGVRLRRLEVERHQGARIGAYLREYAAFMARAGWALARGHRRRRYGLVQVHTLPDFLLLAALPLRALGVPVILDLHEAMPEFFRSRFPRGANRLANRALLLQERAAVRAASHVLTVNEAMRDRLLALGVAAHRVTVIPNSPSLARFDPTAHRGRSFMADGTLRLVYAGALTPIYELDVALEAIARLTEMRPGLSVQLELFGRGDSEPWLREWAERLGIARRVTFRGRIPLDAVAAALAAADVGVAPTRLDHYTRLSLSTKIFEYGAMRRPVVASRLPLVEHTFGPNTVITYEPGDALGLAGAILGLVDDPADRVARVARMADRVAELAWERVSPDYVRLVECLAADGLSFSADRSPDALAGTALDREDA